MKKLAVYPGTFNPWHDGHRDVLKNALKVFDQVIIAVGINPEKRIQASTSVLEIAKEYESDTRITVVSFSTLLKDFAQQAGATAIVRGLRNGQDFELEKTQQYWNEDLGCKIPTAYFISDRNLVHISSSAIRAVEKFK